MGSSCNHVAAALFKMATTIQLGLSNLACTAKPNVWLPNRKDVTSCKTLDMDLNCDDFKKRGKSNRKVLSTPKKNFKLVHSIEKVLNLNPAVESLGVPVGGTIFQLLCQHQKLILFGKLFLKKNYGSASSKH